MNMFNCNKCQYKDVSNTLLKVHNKYFHKDGKFSVQVLRQQVVPDVGSSPSASALSAQALIPNSPPNLLKWYLNRRWIAWWLWRHISNDQNMPFYYHKEYILGCWSCIQGYEGMIQEEMINVSTRMYLIPYSKFTTNTSIRMENSLAISVAIRNQGSRV